MTSPIKWVSNGEVVRRQTDTHGCLDNLFGSLLKMGSVVHIVHHVGQASSEVGVCNFAVFELCFKTPVYSQEERVEMPDNHNIEVSTSYVLKHIALA